MLPFTGNYEVDQFSSSIIRNNKYVPALDGVVCYSFHFIIIITTLLMLFLKDGKVRIPKAYSAN